MNKGVGRVNLSHERTMWNENQMHEKSGQTKDESDVVRTVSEASSHCHIPTRWFDFSSSHIYNGREGKYHLY